MSDRATTDELVLNSAPAFTRPTVRSNEGSIAATTAAPPTHLALAARTAGARPYDREFFTEWCRSADTLVALLVLGAAYLLANADEMPTGIDDFLRLRLHFGNLLALSIFAVLWQQLFRLLDLYDASESRTLRAEAPSVVAACTLGAVLTSGLALLSRSGAFSVAIAIAAWPLTTMAILTTRYGIRVVAERAQARQRRRVLIVGSGALAHRSLRELRADGRETDLVGFVDSNAEQCHQDIQPRLLGRLDQLEEILMRTVVDEVIIALPVKSCYAEIQQVIEQCERAGVQSRYSPTLFRASLARARIETRGSGSAVAMKVVTDDYRLVVKRAMDIAVASVVLLAAVPLMALIALAIRLTSPGPVLFAQERYGWRKRRFRMYKFRTMRRDAEALQPALETLNEARGPVFKIHHDPRITPLGRILRKSSLDELPQLWNVLRGDMSLVGPRPLPLRDVSNFTEASLMRRFSVHPGLTGLWQVSGRCNVPFDQWTALDLAYIDRWSLRLDLRILLLTIPAVLKGTGAT